MKYSIIIPVHNSISYLPTCVETIINQNYYDYELIISDDNSTDGTDVYLSSLDHPNIKIICPPRRLSMVEHFEWSLNHAKGKWIMYVGGDDGLQSYFFSLAEELTKIAGDKNIRVIMSDRAYYFWPGCEILYGNLALDYTSIATVKILNSTYQSMLALFGFQTYFELPQMYSNSLFRKDIIEEVKLGNMGNFFSTIPPDSNLAAIACSQEKKYIKSKVPLGWIGTSPGGVIFSMNSYSNDKLFLSSKIKYHSFAGNFALRSCSVYYWNALISTAYLRKSYINRVLTSKIFRTLLFSSILAEIRLPAKIDSESQLKIFWETVRINKLNKVFIVSSSYLFSFLHKLYNKLVNIYMNYLKNSNPYFKRTLYWDKDKSYNLATISIEISKVTKNIIP